MAEGGGRQRRRDSNISLISEGESQNTQGGLHSDREQYDSPEELLNSRVRELSKVILQHIPARADSIKVEARKACREAAEKVRDYAMEMVGIIRMLKHEVKQKDREIAELRSKGNVPVGAQAGQGELKGIVGVPNRGYAAAAARPKQATYAVKVTAKEEGDIRQVQKLLKTSVDPTKAKVSIAAVRNIKSGAVIVECNTKQDAEKLRTAVEASSKLRGRELEKANPRVILGRIDADLTKDRLMRVIARNNGDLVEACGGLEGFDRQVKEKFRIGGKDQDKYVSVVLEVTSEARKAILRGRINLEWQSVYARDFVSLQQCYKCYGYGHKSAGCKERHQVCGKCGETGHEFKQCKKQVASCIVCVRANETRKGPACRIDHDAKAPQCPTMQRIKQNIIQSIDYGQ
ncbi:hypothetical protein ILUMI_11167 [Ignelater luminosus]|uniref:CCHC-type domain-containing protein n=1 Tax=Ignelater luminosus TaxID=2038154 RepID=A0A8K0GDH3_IGNLU|nr:hypothetical protein ILUMI_11167 [Ignelater luminosus]